MNNPTTTIIPPMRSIPPTVPILMFTFGVVGNVIAIAVLCRTRKEKRETTFYALVYGLAVTDLVGTLLASPVTISTYAQGQWPGGDPLCQYMGFIMLFFSLAGLSIIFAMSVDRYIAVKYPYVYNNHVNQKHAGQTLVAIYISNALFSALPAIGFGQVALQHPQTWCFLDWRTNHTTHAVYSYLYAGVSIFLIFFTVVFNVLLCVVLLRMHKKFLRRMSQGTDSGRISDLRKKSISFVHLADTEIQMILVLVTTTVVVLICSIPLVVQVFLNQLYKPPVELNIAKSPDIQAIRLASFNPILDPWIYILLRKTVLRKVIGKIKYTFAKTGIRRRSITVPLSDVHRNASTSSPSLASEGPQLVRRDSEGFFYESEDIQPATESQLQITEPSDSQNQSKETSTFTDLTVVTCTEDH
ncbi:prostaglandin E receptor 4 (subtype EP4) a [Poecilia reticulata]|uniref:prostaglandin E receptor 4 (subtype EP4) a n=1 Tax=Poecilia reticulata TaxID=8081 RepID=UPI0004A4B04D|nr:PREDICTED: prostaglandin E2 receptor EP4 subtype-like [Poecilia reticulata]